MATPTYPNPEQTNNTDSFALSLVDASPLSSRTIVVSSGLGDGYVDQLDINNPADKAALNFYMKKYRVTFGGVVVQTVDELQKQIDAT